VLEAGKKAFAVFTCKNWIMSAFVNLVMLFPAFLKV
jgi:hypothetical protein